MMTWQEAMDCAAKLLKGAGFELRTVSMQSEACYYGLPGRASCTPASREHARPRDGIGEFRRPHRSDSEHGQVQRSLCRDGAMASGREIRSQSAENREQLGSA